MNRPGSNLPPSAVVKAAAKSAWRATGAYKLTASRAGPLILSFHRVKPDQVSVLDQRLGSVTPNLFERILKTMEDLGFRFISLEEIRALPQRESRKVALVTFDDGLRDVVDYALPVLRSRGIPA